MFRHRPLATVATALAALLLGTVALSGCSSASSSSLAVGAIIPAGNHPVVAIVGDSIESGMGLEPFEAWPALVAVDRRWGLQNFSEPGAGFVAVGATNADFNGQIDQAIAAKANVVLIGASDNDLGQDDAAVAKAMAAAVERLSDALPKAHLIGYNALTGEASDSDLAPLNDALKQAVTAAGGKWIDLGQPYRGQVGLVQDDGEHPTLEGQQAIASVVLSRLDGIV
ncbi:SGNH/GDSL hydrolase family protein [Microbacterium sp. X-17]|uniref:SGNH/GDSL hydrolase family protein n=1 Tax=Microbacterium sp. X-17 TaxID=3144404 RepID=UPI0031F58BFF